MKTMTKNETNAKLERDAAAGDHNARVLLALRRGDPATLAAHKAAIDAISTHTKCADCAAPVRIPNPDGTTPAPAADRPSYWRGTIRCTRCGHDALMAGRI